MPRLPSISVSLLLVSLTVLPPPATAAELTAETVLRSIDRARKFLLGIQNPDGKWTLESDARTTLESPASCCWPC
ncbi:MAG: hypothetical protein CM1200mP2_07650 [Planctomycetaceae bacterium]|nr:MAG: hypothetical protein CM1200mP2_07650 [Planctomycetaceae bacterium]